MKKDVEYKVVPYQRNIELGIDVNCHECTSHNKNKKGYIRFHRDGLDVLHRWIYWEKTGHKPECVMHLCDNRACINPAHLKGGTLSDNNKDRQQKGRTVVPDNNGVKCAAHILSEEEVIITRQLIRLGVAIRDISNRFKVSISTIYDIKSKRTWRGLSDGGVTSG